MMLLLVATVLAADPVLSSTGTVVPLVARKNGLSTEQTKTVINNLVTSLREAGFTNTLDEETTLSQLKANDVSDTLACGGRTPCLLAAAKRVGAKVAVLVSGSQVEDDRAWFVEAFDVDTEQPLERSEWTESGPLHSAQVGQLALKLRAHLRAATPAVVVDAPKVTTLTPQPPPKPIEVKTAAPKPLKPVPIALAAGSAALVVAAAVSLGVALSLEKEANAQTEGRSPYSKSQVLSRVDGSNTLKGVAVGSVVGAVGLGVGALLTW